MKTVYYLFLAADKVVEKVPIRATRAVSHAGALFYFYAFPRKRRLVERNMRRALGPEASDRTVRRTARRATRYYADYWVDILWLPTKSREYVLERFGKVNEAALNAAINAGKGVLVVLPHYGSWEAGAVFLSSLCPFAAVAEILKPPELFDLFCRLRKDVGIDIFPYDSKPETRDAMVESLKGGTMLALLVRPRSEGQGRRSGVLRGAHHSSAGSRGAVSPKRIAHPVRKREEPGERMDRSRDGAHLAGCFRRQG